MDHWVFCISLCLEDQGLFLIPAPSTSTPLLFLVVLVGVALALVYAVIFRNRLLWPDRARSSKSLRSALFQSPA